MIMLKKGQLVIWGKNDSEYIDPNTDFSELNDLEPIDVKSSANSKDVSGYDISFDDFLKKRKELVNNWMNNGGGGHTLKLTNNDKKYPKYLDIAKKKGIDMYGE